MYQSNKQKYVDKKDSLEYDAITRKNNIKKEKIKT